MKRVIKFRAWDDGKMIYEKDIQHLPLEDNDVYRLAKFFCNVRNDSIVMQFAGLFDKKGTEIYEGDIIQYGEKYFYVVKFEDAKFVGYHANNDWGKWGDIYKLAEPGFDKYSYVVIGNIYQNPDLLKSKGG
jgi:uncharacterized phage protein (TIGR01671 family)